MSYNITSPGVYSKQWWGTALNDPIIILRATYPDHHPSTMNRAPQWRPVLGRLVWFYSCWLEKSLPGTADGLYCPSSSRKSLTHFGQLMHTITNATYKGKKAVCSEPDLRAYGVPWAPLRRAYRSVEPIRAGITALDITSANPAGNSKLSSASVPAPTVVWPDPETRGDLRLQPRDNHLVNNNALSRVRHKCNLLQSLPLARPASEVPYTKTQRQVRVRKYWCHWALHPVKPPVSHASARSRS
jgi:hypothetical protein